MIQRVTNREDLYRVLTETMAENGQSRTEVAEKAGMNRCTLYRTSNLSIDNACALAAATGLTIMITNTPALIMRAAANLEI